MVQKQNCSLEEISSLIAAGKLASAVELLRPAYASQNLKEQLALIDILLERQLPREAAKAARRFLQETPHPEVRLRLCEALLALDENEQALESLPNQSPLGELDRFNSTKTRARLGALRQKGAMLWRTGQFDEGKAVYDQIRNEEEIARSVYRKILDSSPSDIFAWKALVDAVGNYRISHALSKANQTERELEKFYLKTVTGREDHPTSRYRCVLASTFSSISDWPDREEILASFPAKERSFVPSSYGQEKQLSRPAVIKTRNVIKLKEALAYDGGMFLWLRSAKGHSPWLHEGMWKEYTGPYVQEKVPSPHVYLDGLGKCLSVLPSPSTRIETPVVVLGYWNNYGHFLHDILGQLQDAEQTLGSEFSILVVESLLPSIREALAFMGYGEDRIVSIGENCTAILKTAYCITPRTQFQRLRILQAPLSLPFYHFDMALDDEGIEFARRRLMNPDQVETKLPWRKIYASRRNTARRPENEQEIEKLLSDKGFEIIIPENLSLKCQIDLFSETRLLVALEGASLANMMFMPSGGDVLVLRSMAWGWSVNCFDELSRIKSLNLTTLDFEGRIVPLEPLKEYLKA